jgi:hypothetical protein
VYKKYQGWYIRVSTRSGQRPKTTRRQVSRDTFGAKRVDLFYQSLGTYWLFLFLFAPLRLGEIYVNWAICFLENSPPMSLNS